MDGQQFRMCARELIDYITQYNEGLRDRFVLPDVSPGYIHDLVPDHAPVNGESWEQLLDDIEPVIMKGMTHWHSPRFHAYFPTANSYPAICGDLLSSSLACIGFSWNAAPACTELEMKMMDWLAEMLGLPEHFRFSSNTGGGVIQSTASEATLIAILGARCKVWRKYGFDSKIDTDEEDDFRPGRNHVNNNIGNTSSFRNGDDFEDDENRRACRYEIMSKMTAYTSNQSHSSVEKATMLAAIRLRSVDVMPDDLSMNVHELRQQIVRDIDRGLIPMIVIATLGTTNTCAFDDLRAIGEICQRYDIWLHVDAAYAGSAFICEEFRHYLDGIEYVTSFSINPHKWMLVNFDCTGFWVRDKKLIEGTFDVNPAYLKHEHQGKIPDYRHWQIPLGRRFRSLKLWFVIRSYGVSGLQEYIRQHVRLAQLFGDLLRDDDRFELMAEIRLGLVCFRLKGSNELNEELVSMIVKSRVLFLTPTVVNGVYIIRFAVCSRSTTERDIHYSWGVIQNYSDMLLIRDRKARSSTK